LKTWDKDSKEARYVRNLARKRPPAYEHYRDFVETRPPEVVIDQQLLRLERDSRLEYRGKRVKPGG